MKKILALPLLLLTCALAFADPTNWILNTSNASVTLTNFRGASQVNSLGGLPLGTVGSSATGELGLKVIIISGGGAGGGGDASAANQTAVQANAGSDASKAEAIQGITGGKAVTVSAASLPLPTGASTSAKQPALGTAGSASADAITIQGIAGMTKVLTTPDSVALPANQSVNESQINGVTPLMGAGNTGTGSQRVTIASDQANVAVKEIATAVVTNSVTTSTTAGTLVASNANRYKLTVYNRDASISVYAGPATVTSSNGALIPAGQSRVFKAGILWQVIAASGTPVVDYVDESY